LMAWGNGDAAALDRLLPYVETELRRLASYHMRRESAGHTLQTTALVNELYLKLVDQKQAKWHNRAHFFAVAAQLMRRILVDYARSQLRSKRGGGVSKVQSGSFANSAPVMQALDSGMATQQWQIIDTDSGYIRIMARHSGKALEVDGGFMVNGTEVQQWDYFGLSHQQWLLRPVN
jgi:RNA polymerase sigma factor (TIGR02999 family)